MEICGGYERLETSAKAERLLQIGIDEVEAKPDVLPDSLEYSIREGGSLLTPTLE